MLGATVLNEPTRSGDTLVERSTLEVTARDAEAAAVLGEYLPRGARVHITYLSNGDHRETIAQAAKLSRAGLEPIPHLAARSLSSREELDDYLARIVGETGASRVLLIAGDLERPRGPFVAALDVLRTGALENGGIKGVVFATHPEGHPVVAAASMETALADKLAYAAANGLEAEIVSQFCFEARPIVDHIARLRRLGVAAPVRIGLAAPTSAALMVKFALRCGIGPSLRALNAQSSRLGQLMEIAGPETVIAELTRALVGEAFGDIAGLHFFVFGGVRKAAVWLKAQRSEAAKFGGGAE